MAGCIVVKLGSVNGLSGANFLATLSAAALWASTANDWTDPVPVTVLAAKFGTGAAFAMLRRLLGAQAGWVLRWRKESAQSPRRRLVLRAGCMFSAHVLNSPTPSSGVALLMVLVQPIGRNRYGLMGATPDMDRNAADLS